MTEALTPQQFDELCRVMADTFKRDDFERVLERYPGREGPGTCLADNAVPLQLATSCMKAVKLEGTILPFLSRVVEQKWKDEKFRTTIVGKVRVLVRTSSVVEPHATTIVAALTALTAALAASPSPQCPGPATCAFVRQSRSPLQVFIASLEQFDALKALHDSLHVLQVNGADWLDEDQTDDSRDLPREAFVSIVERLRDVAAAVEPRLPAELVESCRRCHDIATSAAQQLVSGAGHGPEYALAELRALVAREPALIDDAMFAVSRDLPLRTLRDLIESGASVPGAPGLQMQAAAQALRSLSETLRARILEHALWQATEMRIRALGRLFGDPTGGFLGELVAEWNAIKQNLRVLIDPAPNMPAPDLALTGALVLYERSLPMRGRPAPSGPSPEERLAEMAVVFDEFRLKMNLHFLAVDKALKAEFSSLLPLHASLQALDGQISNFCTCP
jgi:hypothetical protein